MTMDQQRLRQLLPLVIPVLLFVAGWMFLIRPASAERTRTARQLQGLRPRLDSVRMALAEAPPPPLTIEPAKSFERQVTSGDPGRILEELSRLTPRQRYRNLSIDASGEGGELRAQSGPQVGSGPAVDPRFSLFSTPLTYVPITMSFDADYASAGELLWRLRDLATIVEIRSLQIEPVDDTPPDAAAGAAPVVRGARPEGVHVTLTLFAYARVPAVAHGAAVAFGADRQAGVPGGMQ